MKILAFDTCNGVCSTSLQIDNKICSFIEEKQVSMQSAKIISMIERVLQDNNINYLDLDALAVNIGPGSFTGVRIGIAVAKGIKLVTKLPIVGVSGLLSLACSTPKQNKYILSLMDARRSQVYMQLFDKDYNQVTEVLLKNYDQVNEILPEGEFILIGEGARYLSPYINKKHNIYSDNHVIDAKMVMLAANHILSMDKNYDSCSPLYIREIDAKISSH
jgi:tRNA threonylcarbamoyl adenosine modification protein YeaZ